MHISEKLRHTYWRPSLYAPLEKEAAMPDILRAGGKLVSGIKGLFGRGAKYTPAELARLEQIKGIPTTQVRGWSGLPTSAPTSTAPARVNPAQSAARQRRLADHGPLRTTSDGSQHLRRADGQMFALEPGSSLTPEQALRLSKAPASHPGWDNLRRVSDGARSESTAILGSPLGRVETPTVKPTMNSLSRNRGFKREAVNLRPPVVAPFEEMTTVQRARMNAGKGSEGMRNWIRPSSSQSEMTAVRRSPWLESVKSSSAFKFAHVLDLFRAFTFQPQ